MDQFQLALLVGATVTAILSSRVPRATLWIFMGAMSFILSAMWEYHGFPNRDFFGAITNIVICLMLYAFAQYRWEMRVWNAFHIMIVLDLLHMTGLINSHYWLIVSLEIANWTALLIIGATGLMEGYGRGVLSARHHRPGWLDPVYHSLYAPRRNRPFWEVSER